MPKTTSRREFLKTAVGAAGVGLGASATSSGAEEAQKIKPKAARRPPKDRLNLAFIGVGGRGYSNLRSLSGENVVALCDVDRKWPEKAFEQFPKAKAFRDFRVMFDKLHNQIDGVVVSTPDHMHAVAAMQAIKLGKHVYCEKPLAHDIHEVRELTKAAQQAGVVTQMGNQGTSNATFRAGVEAIRSGVIGDVREVHVWTDRPVWPQGQPTPKDGDTPPEHLAWDLWLGTAPQRPYKSGKYHPFFWRGWWDFGTGALGDMGCHTANLPYMALDLTAPTTIESENSGFSKDSFPTWSIIRYAFPARGQQPPVTWTWYDGGAMKPAKVYRKLMALIHGEKLAPSGCVMIGEKGTWYSPHNYGGTWMLLPKERFQDWTPPDPTLPRSPGHHQEWVRACKGGPRPMSHFGYAGPLTETILLGNIATFAGKQVAWDAAAGKITNCPEADARIRREYRAGWTL